MLTLGSINLGTVWFCRLATRPECGLENSGPDHTPRPPPWPVSAVLATLHSPPPSTQHKAAPISLGLVVLSHARTVERAVGERVEEYSIVPSR